MCTHTQSTEKLLYLTYTKGNPYLPPTNAILMYLIFARASPSFICFCCAPLCFTGFTQTKKINIESTHRSLTKKKNPKTHILAVSIALIFIPPPTNILPLYLSHVLCLFFYYYSDCCCQIPKTCAPNTHSGKRRNCDSHQNKNMKNNNKNGFSALDIL